jgi:hypothetical protein
MTCAWAERAQERRGRASTLAISVSIPDVATIDRVPPDHPTSASTAAEIRGFYERTGGGGVALVGVYLAPFSGIAFLWFVAVVRDLIGEREDRFFATVFLSGRARPACWPAQVAAFRALMQVVDARA